MLPKPRYLSLQKQLCSPITLHKELIFDNPEDHFHVELFQRIAYDSGNRVIDLTESICHVLRKNYGFSQECQVYVYDPFVGDFRFLAYFPEQNSIVLGQQFLQADTLLFRIKFVPQQIKLYAAQVIQNENQVQESLHEQDEIQEQDQIPELEEAGAQVQQKSKRRRTIKEMLQVIDQWRKLYYQYNSKLTLVEGAEMIGISKKNLETYIQMVKLGEKYNYPFKTNLENKINELKKFLKTKSQVKKNQEIEMVAKFKHFYQ